MSIWILVLIASLLIIIVLAYIVYKILTVPPQPEYLCQGNSPPEGTFEISNTGINGSPIFASNTPSLNGFYNLTFGTLRRSRFRYENGRLILNGTNLVWTRMVTNNVGYVRLTEEKEELETQLWLVSDGRIISPDGIYIVVIGSISGAYVPQNLANLLGKDDTSARKLLNVLDLPTLEHDERAEWNWYASILLYHSDIERAKQSYVSAFQHITDNTKFKCLLDNFQWFAYKLKSNGKILLSSPEYVTDMSVLNPSIVRKDDKYLIALRHTNFIRKGTNYTTRDGSPIRTTYTIHSYDENLQFIESKPLVTNIDELGKIDMRVQGVEDIRIGYTETSANCYGKDLWFTGTTYQLGSPTKMVIGSLTEENDKYVAKLTLPNQIQPFRAQKNWLPIIGTDTFIYGWNPIQIYDSNDTLVRELTTQIAAIKNASGSSCAILWNNGYLCIIHHVIVVNDERRYISAFVHLTDNDAKVSRPFVMEYVHGLEYISGIAMKDSELLITYGIDDKYAVLSRVPISEVESLFN